VVLPPPPSVGFPGVQTVTSSGVHAKERVTELPSPTRHGAQYRPAGPPLPFPSSLAPRTAQKRPFFFPFDCNQPFPHRDLRALLFGGGAWLEEGPSFNLFFRSPFPSPLRFDKTDFSFSWHTSCVPLTRLDRFC